MRRYLLTLCAILFAGGGYAWWQTPDSAEASADDWLTDYAHARQVAKQTGKPILLVFR